MKSIFSKFAWRTRHARRSPGPRPTPCSSHSAASPTQCPQAGPPNLNLEPQISYNLKLKYIEVSSSLRKSILCIFFIAYTIIVAYLLSSQGAMSVKSGICVNYPLKGVWLGTT